MGKQSDVAIVGGGAIGLACAWRLAQRGALVTLFESGAIGGQASHAAGGMLAPGPEFWLHQPSAALRELGVHSRDLYPDFAAELLELTGVDIELCQIGSPTQDWRETGILVVPDDVICGPESCLWNGREAFWFARDGQVEPRKLVEALRLACEKTGVCLRENTPVCELEIESARVRTLKTRGESFAPAEILLCAGAWSGKISGLPARVIPPVRPLAGQMLQLRGERLLKHVVYGANCYLIPRRDGRLLVGATVEEVGFEKRVTAGGVAKLLNAALDLAPVLRDASFETSWAGLRPATPDGLPILGRGPLENLSYATGHGRNGILLALITAQITTNALLCGENVPRAFEIGRFAKS